MYVIKMVGVPVSLRYWKEEVIKNNIFLIHRESNPSSYITGRYSNHRTTSEKYGRS